VVDPNILKEIRFFEELSDERIERLAAIAELRMYEQGAFLNKQKRVRISFFEI